MALSRFLPRARLGGRPKAQVLDTGCRLAGPFPGKRSARSSRPWTRACAPGHQAVKRSQGTSGLTSGGRQAEPEAGLLRRRFGPHTAAAELDQGLHDRQTDAGAAAGRVARLVDAIEALEDMREILGR